MSCVTNLLLLPQPPSELSIAALKAAYGPTLTHVLKACAQKAGRKKVVILDIAVLLNDQPKQEISCARSFLFSSFQSVLASIYRLSCFLCQEIGINPVGSNNVDVRVLLLDNLKGHPDSCGEIPLRGPIFSVEYLASATKPWQVVYGNDGEAGESLLSHFISTRRERKGLPSFEVGGPGGGATLLYAKAEGGLRRSKNALGDGKEADRTRHVVVAVGGTFDHLHDGHKLLLAATAIVLEPSKGPRRLIIGITGDELLVNKKHAEVLESWEDRQKAAFTFLCDIITLQKAGAMVDKIERVEGDGPNETGVLYHLHGNLTIECIKISDPFGPTITDESVSALVVSGETRSGGQAVNDKRKEKGWPSLQVFEVDVLAASENEVTDKMSSTKIREQIAVTRASI